MSDDVVVVLNFHGRFDTIACVESLVAGSPEGTIVVVDNGSHDGTLEAVMVRWPWVHTIQNPQNLGFAGGMNTGLRWALERGVDTVTVLNNDTIVSVGAIARLAAVAGSGVAVSPEVRYADGTEKVWFAGGTIDVATGLARHLSDTEIATIPLHDGLRPCTTLAGCCVTAKASTWERVGLFDERYFLNFEDADWSVRAAGKGVALVVDPSVHIHHKVSASFTGAYSYLGFFFYTRNGLLFIHERLGGTWCQAARFLRRHVVPGLVHHARRRDRVELQRRLLVVAAALWGRLRGTYGRAPGWLERRAAGWSARS